MDFFRSHTPEAKAAFVRGGKRMLPFMERYYAAHADEESGFRLGPRVQFGTDVRGNWLFLHGRDPAGRQLDLLVEETPDGPRLDWRFLTGAGDMEWGDWVAQRPAAPVRMRVIARLDDYWPEPFSDRNEWISLRLASADNTSTVWAYVRRDSDPGRTVTQGLTGRGDVRLTGVFAFAAASDAVSARTPLATLLQTQPGGWLDASPEAAGKSTAF